MPATPPQPLQIFSWEKTKYRLLLSQEATTGRQSVIESVTLPGGGPPIHIHSDADETFVILSGDVVFWVNGTEIAKGPGEAVFVPRGAEHTFQVVGTLPARMLAVLSPGGCEGFYQEMASGQFRIPQDMQNITKIAERYQLTFTGPPIAVNN